MQKNNDRCDQNIKVAHVRRTNFTGSAEKTFFHRSIYLSHKVIFIIAHILHFSTIAAEISKPLTKKKAVKRIRYESPQCAKAANVINQRCKVSFYEDISCLQVAFFARSRQRRSSSSVRGLGNDPLFSCRERNMPVSISHTVAITKPPPPILYSRRIVHFPGGQGIGGGFSRGVSQRAALLPGSLRKSRGEMPYSFLKAR